MSRPVRVFISYAMEDSHWVKRLAVALQGMEQDKLVYVLHERDILPGQLWQDEIFRIIKSSDAVVLLISSHYLMSNFILQHELPYIMNMNKTGDLSLLPVVIGDCDYSMLNIGKDFDVAMLKILPDNNGELCGIELIVNKLYNYIITLHNAINNDSAYIEKSHLQEYSISNYVGSDKIVNLLVKNFTVLSTENLQFGSRLNVFVGENGTGKTHILKLLYSIVAQSVRNKIQYPLSIPVKSSLQTGLASQLIEIFRPDLLGRLLRQNSGRERCDIQLKFNQSDLNLDFSFSSNSRSEVSISSLPARWLHHEAVFIPTNEVLSIYPNFTSVYDGSYLEFDRTWRDLCQLIGRPVFIKKSGKGVSQLLTSLEQSMQGKLILDKNGRFYLQTGHYKREIHLVAEGVRKLGILARLILTGALRENSYLFWDEPEANLNPKMQKNVAEIIVALADNGVQIFLTTHSLFLLRELEIVCNRKKFFQEEIRYFALVADRDRVHVQQGSELSDLGNVIILEEALQQSDRYLIMD
ncbi:MAG: AAA family ATPase [Magnetococcales bacterium]|nr:AAA family ATPase [Magnetococcales bacterium]